MRSPDVKPEHEVAYQELVAMLRRHADVLDAVELLAIGANMLGKLLALQDQRVRTAEQYMEIVSQNLEIGNKQAIEQIMASKGSA